MCPLIRFIRKNVAFVDLGIGWVDRTNHGHHYTRKTPGVARSFMIVIEF